MSTRVQPRDVDARSLKHSGGIGAGDRLRGGLQRIGAVQTQQGHGEAPERAATRRQGPGVSEPVLAVVLGPNQSLLVETEPHVLAQPDYNNVRYLFTFLTAVVFGTMYWNVGNDM